MRFHRIKLKNLNSLYGDHVIDFDVEMKEAPMFLILGPTGAGKSTILDAVCLALFGQTPRLNRKTGKPETDVGHILSQGTAESSAELEFSVRNDAGDRDRFLAVWSCRRAYDDPEGAVQRPERSLYRYRPNGELQLIVSDHREKFFQEHFDTALAGLTVGDFQRTILLAQGEFNAFLTSESREKAKILERLTNTDEYREIGSRAAAKKRDAEARLKEIDAALSEVAHDQTIDPEKLSDELEAVKKELARTTDLRDLLREHHEWHTRRAQLHSDRDRASTNLESGLKAKEDHSDMFQRRDRDAQVRDAEAPLLLYRELDQTITDLEVQSPKLLGEQSEAAKEVQTLKETVESASKQRDESVRQFEALKPEIERAVEVYTKLATAESELSQAEESQRETKDMLAQVTIAFEKAKEAFDQSSDAVERVDAKQKAFGERLKLTDVFPSLKTTYEHAVRPIVSELEQIAERIATHETELTELMTTRQPLDEAVAALQKNRSSQKAAVTRVTNEVNALGVNDLDDAIDGLRLRIDGGVDSMKALGEASLLLDRILDTEKERTQVEAQLTSLRKELTELKEEQAQAKELEAAHLETLKSRNEAVRLNEQLRALSALRTQLEQGEPCPLCGSPLHPFSASDELAEHEQKHQDEHERLLVEQESAQSKVKDANERVQRIAAKYVARMTAKQHDESQLISVKERLEVDQKAFGKSLEKAGFSPLEAFELKEQTKLAALAGERETSISELRDTLTAYTDLRARLKSSSEKLETLDVEIRAKRDEIKTIDSKITVTRSRIEDAKEEQHKAIKKRDAALSEITDTLVGIGIDAGDGIMERAETIHKEIVDNASLLETLRSEKETSHARLREVEISLKSADASHQKSTSQVDARKNARDALKQEAAERLDGENPVDVRQTWNTRIDGARKEVEAATVALNKRQTEKATLDERVSAIAKRIAQTKEKRDDAKATLQEKLAVHEMDVEELNSRLLAPEDRVEIERACHEIEQEITEQKARLKEIDEQMDTHRLKRPKTNEATRAVVDEPDKIADELESVVTLVAQTTESLGVLQEKWRAYERATSRQKELAEQRRDAKEQLEVWTRIYKVIGVGDGQRFQEFAQSINLRGLVERANARLEHLYPRYHLSVAENDDGSPTMEFIVRDRYQANSERPLTTLSGGETFLVSLALALALADYRKISMPIETLLLDEGFGTLDEDALHLALMTLHQLHRDGARQIGIISHVASLRELVDSRIVIEPQGHGRSEIRFEFGSEDTEMVL